MAQKDGGLLTGFTNGSMSEFHALRILEWNVEASKALVRLTPRHA